MFIRIYYNIPRNKKKPGAQTEAQPTEHYGLDRSPFSTANETEAIKISCYSVSFIPLNFQILEMVKARQPRKLSRTTSSWWTLLLMSLVLCSFLVVVVLALRILSNANTNTSSVLSKPNHLNSIARNTHVEAEQHHHRERWVEIISWEPRAFLYHNFLTKEECEYLVSIATPNMRKSEVVDNETGKSKDSRVRTSSGAFLVRGRDKIVRNIEKKIAEFSFIPIEHGEGLHVLHYEVGQKYDPHFDYFMDEFNTKNGGQRIATMLMYISDVEEGGETVFPNAKGNFSSVPWWNELSDCGKKGLSIKPKMGDALLFWSMKPDGTLDPLSLHGSCPVIKGNKWSCTKWMRLTEYKT
ncbi:hypothetical protein VNO78_35024 [Psophocarpus tetragonolobus]|uniref:procollagen-proline 4-dioxygenase n=1 Tax=Psophocarpus tetragonolobus TaxID=3891 RepID=A0AAN9NN28_PSOTE